jgi:AraC-like DNA-binding protein
MIEIKEENTKHELLKPYLYGYGIMKISNISIQEKELLPWPGISWMFVNQPFFIDNDQFANSCIIGLREKLADFRWNGNDLEVLAVKFKPYGLTQFTDVSMKMLKDKALQPEQIWNDVNLIQSLYSSLIKPTSIDKKINEIEDFLLSALRQESSINNSIFQFIDQIQSSPSIDIKLLKQQIPLSERQLERKIKQLLGVNLMAFMRINRFYFAKMALLQNNIDSLTELGYEAGYFDQSHFSKEFKRLSSLPPKEFPKTFPIFNLISEENKKLP